MPISPRVIFDVLLLDVRELHLPLQILQPHVEVIFGPGHIRVHHGLLPPRKPRRRIGQVLDFLKECRPS